MIDTNPTALRDTLREAGLRPTKQRLALARLLLGGGHRHVTADDLLAEARAQGVSVAQTTVYNVLHQFHRAGLLKEGLVESGRTWYDTKTGSHMHLYDEETGAVSDLDQDPRALQILDKLELPDDVDVMSVDVVVRVRAKKNQI
ncbi:MAG: transcriptional repressor [Ectothiorhodospiraceae bacterium]|nr:transcriptional repressor [Ectothiorhodospiraceae bacterium]